MICCVNCVFVHGMLCGLSLYMVGCVDCVSVHGRLCGLCLCTW